MKFFLGKPIVVVREQGELKDLVPARHGSFVNIGGLQDRVLLMILHFYLDVGFHLRHIVQLLLRLGVPVLAIVFKGFLPVEVGVASRVLRQIWSGALRLIQWSIAVFFSLQVLVVVIDD